MYPFLICCFHFQYLPTYVQPNRDAQHGFLGCLALHSTGGHTALGKGASGIQLSIIDSSQRSMTTLMPMQTLLVVSSEIIPSSGIFFN